MSTFDITNHAFKFSNIKYFRSKAEDVQIGSYGEKKDPIGAMAYLACEGKVTAPNLAGKVQYKGRANIDWTGATKAKFNAAGMFKYLTLQGSGASAVTWNSKKSAKLDLVKFTIDAGPLKNMLNNGAGGARNFLKREGKDGRIVSTIFVVMDAELAEGLDAAASSSGSFTAELTKQLGIGFTADHVGSRNQQVDVTLSPGMTFAYGMHKVSDWNRGKTRIEDLEDDRKGMG